ncbi:MAG: cobaltochelatase subunit CobN [Desulfotomaculales bacterium]
MGQSDLDVLRFDEKIRKETIDPERYPSREAYAVGEKLAREAMSRFRAEKGSYPLRVAAVIWGKETAGREGPMVSFALALLGVKPRWDASGRVVDLELISPGELGRPRIDVIMVVTGLFRDLFKNQIFLLDRAHRLALAASYQSIVSAYPDLQRALDASLAPLGTAGLFVEGREPLDSNYIAGSWIFAVRELLAKGHQPEEAGELATARIFAPPAGEFGSGVDVVRSPQDPEKVANQFVNRLGNVYSETDWGANRPEVFKELLKGCNVLFHCYSESSILDQDDLPLEYTYVPGLRAALEKWGGGEVEKITGTRYGLQGDETGKEPGQQEDSRVRLGEKKSAPAVQKKPSAEGEEPVQTKSQQHQTSSAPLPPRAPEAKLGPLIFEVEPIPLPATHSQGQTSCWPAVGVLLALLAMGGAKGFVRHRREFGQVHPIGF